MPFKAYEIYKEYEPDKYKTSTEKKVEKALEEAKKEGLGPVKESLDFQETREIFENDFIGIEEAEKFIGRPLSQEEKNLAEEKWQKKIEEQNLTKETLEELKKEGFMVVLRVPELYDEKKKENIPATILNLKKKFPLFYNQDWYKNEKFVKEAISGIDWGIVKKEILEESRSQNWDDQEKILEEWAKTHKVDPQFVHRRKPVEVAYDVLAYFNNRNQRILEKDYDWTSVQSSDGWFVSVGYFYSDGLGVDSGTRGSRGSILGVCPAR
jgi:isocitrate/isopropylmalate dehydrogenase